MRAKLVHISLNTSKSMFCQHELQLKGPRIPGVWGARLPGGRIAHAQIPLLGPSGGVQTWREAHPPLKRGPGGVIYSMSRGHIAHEGGTPPKRGSRGALRGGRGVNWGPGGGTPPKGVRGALPGGEGASQGGCGGPIWGPRGPPEGPGRSFGGCVAL